MIASTRFSLRFLRGKPFEINGFCHLLCGAVIACVGVDIQRNAHIRVTHDILQSLDAHACVRHVRAEGVAEYMGCDTRERLIRVQLLVFLYGPAHSILDVQGNLWGAVLVQKKKTAIPVDNRFCFYTLAAGKHVLQAPVNLIGHGNVTAAARSLSFLHIILAASLTDKPMIHPDFSPGKVQISLCQTAKLADAHPCPQKNNKLVIILAVGLVLPDEIHPKRLLFLRHGNTLLRIVGNHIDQLEIERIPADHILVICHLESRFDNAPDAGEGGVSLAVLMQPHDPFLCIRNLDVPDGTKVEIFFLHQVQRKVLADFGVVAHALLEADIAFQQLNHGDFARRIVDAIIKLLLDFLFFFSAVLSDRRNTPSAVFRECLYTDMDKSSLFSGSLLSAEYVPCCLYVFRTLSNSFP